MSLDAGKRSDEESALIVEARVDGEWRAVTRLGPSSPPASVSHNGPAGRQVYVYRCCGDHSVLLRSKAGADVTDGELRVLPSAGLEDVARLTPEAPTTDFWLRFDGADDSLHVRFRHESVT
jgi:hypothetical protein